MTEILRDFSTGLFFTSEMARLGRAGARVGEHFGEVGGIAPVHEGA